MSNHGLFLSLEFIMEIFGWFCMLILAIAMTVGLVVGGYIQYMFSGGFKRDEFLSLALISIVPITMWYAVFVTFPFIVGVR